MSKKFKVKIWEQGRWAFSCTFVDKFDHTERIYQVFTIDF